LEFKGRQDGPSATMTLSDWQVFGDMIAHGEIGLAEAYMDGRWDSSDLADLLTFGLMNNGELEHFFHGKPIYALWLKLKSYLQLNSIAGSRRNISHHYDLGNAFYKLWLDESMTYSGALFRGGRNLSLEEAQQAKYQRILSKLSGQVGDHI